MPNQDSLAQARQESDEAQERFEITFDANPAPSMIVRLEDAKVVATNSGLHEVSGRDNDEVKGRSVRELHLFADEEAFERILDILRGGGSTTKETLTMCSHTQGERIMLVSAKPIDLEGDTCGIFSFADVTELKQAEKNARRSGQRFAQAFHLAPLPVILSTLGRGETFLEVNEAFLALLGYARDEVVGKHTFDLDMWSSPKDRHRIEEVQKDGRGYRDLELQVRNKEGAVYDVLVSAEVIRLDGNEGYLKMFYDVSDRKKSEAQMAAAIQSIMSDASWFSRELIARLNHVRLGGELESYKGIEGLNLSTREREVLERIARGWRNKRIAQDLKLKEQTVRNYIFSLYEKLGVHTRTEAAVWARERGFTGE